MPVSATLKKYLTPNVVLWGGILLVSAALVAVYFAARGALLQSAVESEGQQNAVLAQVIMAHTDEVISQADAVAGYVQTNWRQIKRSEIRKLMQSNLSAQGAITQVNISDATGRVTWSTLDQALALSIADRLPFKAHLSDQRAEYFLGDPVIGKASKKWSVHLSRRLAASDGRFAGVVVVVIDAEYLSAEFGELELSRSARISVANVDSGRIFARSHVNAPKGPAPQSSFATGGSFAGTPNFEQARAVKAGHREGVNVTTGEPSIYGWRQSDTYPLITLVATDRKAGLGLYRQSEFNLRIAILCVIVMLYCVGLIISRTMRLQKTALSQMRDARALAEQADSFKNEFINAISHEVRGPLTNIKGFAELWVMQPLDHETSKDYALTILRAVDHVDRVVSQLLDAEKGSAGQLQLFPSAVDIRKLISDCVHIHRAQAEKKGLVLSSNFSGDERQIIYIDGFRFAQILHNLLSNAVKFTIEGTVEVAAHLSATRLNVSVHDSGPGIPPQYRETIFERFRQGDPELSRIHGGTGLGLNLCQTLAVLMGGTISFDSTVGAGTTFNVEIPYANSGPERSGAHAERRQAPPAVF